MSIKKRNFLKLFQVTWDKSFTQENIFHAFEKPGIWPLKPELVLSIITRPIKPLLIIDFKHTIEDIKTPKSTKSIWHFQNDYRKNPIKLKLKKLFKANIELFT
jgi:hypothetical protein